MHPTAPSASPDCTAPSGPRGPFADEVCCDTAGPALRATVEYRRDQGVAAHSQLVLPGHRPRGKLCLGYGNTVLAELCRPPYGRPGQQLRLLDLTQTAAPPARPAPPHPQRLGFGLTDALPTDLSGASPATWAVLAEFPDLPDDSELLRAEFLPGDQRPNALVVRWHGAPEPRGKTRTPERWQVHWLGLRGAWQTHLLGAPISGTALVDAMLMHNGRNPQVLTNANADDAGRNFVLGDGPLDFDVRAFGDTDGVEVNFFAPFVPRPNAGLEVPPHWPNGNWLDKASTRAARLGGVACSSNGVIAAMLDGKLHVRRGYERPANFSGFDVPRPKVIPETWSLRLANVQLAADAQILACTWIGRSPTEPDTERYAAGLFALDFDNGLARSVQVPFDRGVDGRHVAIALASCELDAQDIARLQAATYEEAHNLGGLRLLRTVRRLAQQPVPQVQLRVAVAFANVTQMFRLDVRPWKPVGTARGHHACVPLAQSYPSHEASEAASMHEFNAEFRLRLFGAGALDVVLGFDDMRHLYPRAYGAFDEERDNGVLRGGIRPIRLAETRPFVLAEAARNQQVLRPNEVTLGPFMSRDGRWLFAGLDGNRLQRWDFAPLENGHLAPGRHEPQLQPHNQRPRTATFSPTPATRHSREAYLGHFQVQPPLPLRGPDPTPADVYRAMGMAERPRPPTWLRQVVGFGASKDDAQNSVMRGEEAWPPARDDVSWGSGVWDTFAAEDLEQTEVVLAPRAYERGTFEAVPFAPYAADAAAEDAVPDPAPDPAPEKNSEAATAADPGGAPGTARRRERTARVFS